MNFRLGAGAGSRTGPPPPPLPLPSLSPPTPLVAHLKIALRRLEGRDRVGGVLRGIGLGLLGRLMPTLQVFFFGLPFQIGVQIWILAISVSGILVVFLRSFEEGYRGFKLP